MQTEKTVRCQHCGGDGKCACAECVKKAGFQPAKWGYNDIVICKSCNGSGLQRI